MSDGQFGLGHEGDNQALLASRQEQAQLRPQMSPLIRWCLPFLMHSLVPASLFVRLCQACAF